MGFHGVGLLLPPGIGLDIEHVAVLDEAVHEGRDACGTGKHRPPLLERQVGGDDRRALLMALAGDVVEAQVLGQRRLAHATGAAQQHGKRSADHTFREREEPFSVAFQEV